jgi:phosphatidate cytidylyltransferase
MLRWRLILGTLFIAALVMICWLDAKVTRPGAFLLPLALMLSWVAVVELLDMFNQRGRKPLAWTLYVGVLLSVLLAGMPLFWQGSVDGNRLAGMGWLAIGLIAALLLAIIGELQRYDGRWHTTVNLGLSAFTILYVGGLMGCLVQLRVVGVNPASTDGSVGMFALVSMIAIVKMSDTGQYTFGRLFGRHKLSPLVSPGKTWEGAAGGVACAIATSWFIFSWVAPRMAPATNLNLRPQTIVSYAILLAAAGIIGDLAESMLKRDAGVKDSSTWLPGFGGVLDLLDSLLGAAPVAFFFWVVVILGI